MALPIKSIPELTGEAAERFIKFADGAKIGFIDFAEQVEISRKIIEKSVEKMKSMKMTQKEMRDIIITI